MSGSYWAGRISKLEHKIETSIDGFGHRLDGLDQSVLNLEAQLNGISKKLKDDMPETIERKVELAVIKALKPN